MIYVDPVQRYKSGLWCHMLGDSGVAELHALAQRIGLKAHWFQENASFPHYDLRPSMRERAIKAGAKEISGRDLGALLLRLRGASAKE